MLVSYSAMSLGDLKAVDKVIKVARELDRYHGFGQHSHVAQVRGADAGRAAAPGPAGASRGARSA